MITVLLSLLLTLAQAPAPPAPTADRPADNSQEAFVIEQMTSKLRFDDDGTGRREIQARVRVQSDAGVKMWGQLVFGYNAATERLDIQHVRVHKADGSVVTASADAVQELTSPVQQQAPVYTDFRQKHVTVPGLRPGETLEYAIVSTVHTALAAGHFWTEYDFERRAIVLDEQLEIDIPASRSIILRTASDAQPTVTDSDGRRTYRWKKANLERAKEKTEEELEAEAAEEAETPRRAAVRLTTFESWDEVGRWYLGLEQAPRTVTPEIRQKAQALTAGSKTDLEKLEALYDFVAPTFRYVSISLGMGRYQPRAAADVLRDQYGDCKDKHTLLAALMEAEGLRASTVLINSRTKMDRDFPSPSQFDHAITFARVDGVDVWLDVTTEVAPFRLLSPNLRKKEALIVSPDGSRIEASPADPPMQSMAIQEITGTLGELGTFKGSIKLRYRGDVELLLRTIFRATPAANWKEVVEGFDTNAGINGEVSEFKVSDPAATREPFEIEYTVSKVRFVDWTKPSVAMKLPLSHLTLESPRENATRPIELGAPTQLDYKLDLTLGAGYRGRAPLPVALKRDYAAYSSTYALEDNRFTARRHLELRTGSLPIERAGDYRAFLRTVNADNEQSLSLEIEPTAASSPAPDLKAPELIRSGNDAVQSRNYAQAVPLLERALELTPKDTKAWNSLGDAYVGLRQYDKALAAYDRILEMNPYDEFVHNDIAYVRTLQHRHAEAEVAYRKQLELNPLDKYAHNRLGGLLVEMKRYDDAVTQLEKAISLSPNDATLRVDLGTAYLQLSRDAEALTAFDKAVELDATPTTWNNVAYQLALKGVHLDRAQQYAESAVSTASASSRNFTVHPVTARELAIVGSLASYWDTLGWVYFAKGDLAAAERLVSASWSLVQSAEVGGHLGQIYQKQGRTADAIRMFAASINADGPADQLREQLGAIADGNVEALIAEHKDDLLEMRTYPLDTPADLRGMADVVMLLGQDARVEALHFVTAAAPMRPLVETALRKLQIGPALPAVAPAKLLRRGVVTCQASGCSLIVVSADLARPVQ